MLGAMQLHRTAAPLAALLVVVAVHGCTCSDEGGSSDTPAPKIEELIVKRVPDTNVVLSLPKGWVVEMPNPGPLPKPTPGQTKVVLQTRMLLEARPGSPFKGTLVTPLLQVLEDPWLPVGTTGVDYLVAQRAANQTVIGANIRHVDAEPSRREGRPTYHIRDEWTVKGPDGASRDVSQEALLMLETATTPEGGPAMHGYTVVITMEKIEFAAMQPTVRAILDSVRFDQREAPVKPAE
jgi:hypothetical protein